MEAKPGDTIIIKQSDGNTIMVIVGDDMIIVKAERIGTELNIERNSSFTVTVRAVEEER